MGFTLAEVESKKIWTTDCPTNLMLAQPHQRCLEPGLVARTVNLFRARPSASPVGDQHRPRRSGIRRYELRSCFLSFWILRDASRSLSSGAHSRDPLAMLLRMRFQTLMVRSASARVSNHEATGGAT